MYAPKFAVYHTLPSLPASNPCGPEFGGSLLTAFFLPSAQDDIGSHLG
jgi:hypothetical protein